MASVDDLDELIATRKLNGVNDNLYRDGTGINVGSIEEDINILKGIDIKFLLSGSIEQSNYIIDEANKINKSIEHLLQDYKRQKQINEELKNKLLDTMKGTEIIKEETPEYIKENYISKQKIKDKIEKIFDVKIHNYNYLADTDWNYSQEQMDRQIASLLQIVLNEVLEELFQESEDK